MLRRLARPLMVWIAWIAFAAALVLPGRARAALLPVCDAREHASIDLVAASHRLEIADPGAGTRCDGPPVSEEAAGPTASRVAPICDPRGASAIAPQRVEPIADGRIEAAPCGVDLLSPLIGPGPRGEGPSAPPALPPFAVLADGLPVPVASFTLGPPYPPPGGRASAGVARAVDHVPIA